MTTIMKLIISAIATILLGIGVFFYATTHQHTGEITDRPEQDINNAVYVIIDGSGSGRTTYAVPKVDTTLVNQLIDKIRQSGKGELWVTHIDQSARNNQVAYMQIEKALPMVVEEPKRRPGEVMSAFNKRLTQYKADLRTHTARSDASRHDFDENQRHFTEDCQRIIDEAYAQRNAGSDWSDIHGSINSALRTLNTVISDSTKYRTILLVSDGVQSLPAGVKSEPIDSIPTDIKIILVNASGSPNHALKGRAIEMESLARGLRIAVNGNTNP